MAARRLPAWLFALALAAAALALWLGVGLLVPGCVGTLNDDGVYATTARALAAGRGYIHPFALGWQPANRYPIGYPLLLVPLVWAVPSLAAQLLAMQVLSLACVGIFVLTSCWVLARYIRLDVKDAALVTLLLAANPWLARYGSQVMADLPFAAASTAVLAGLGALLEKSEPRSRSWQALGLAMSCLVVVRYQGLALLVATLGFLWIARRKRTLADLALGASLPLVAWALWLGWMSVHQGAGAYAEATRSGAFLAALTPLQRLAAFGMSLRFLFLAVLPGFLAAFFAPPGSPDPLLVNMAGWDMAEALFTSGLVIWGLLRALTRGRADLSAAVACYVVVSLGLIAVWNTSFTFLGFAQAVRLALPLAPWIMAFGLLGLDGFIRALAPKAPSWGVRLMFGASVLGALGLDLATFEHPLVSPQRAAAYARAYAFVSAQTPPDARIGSLLPAMTYLYTDRVGETFSLSDPALFLQQASTDHLGYVLVLRGLYGYLGEGPDPIDTFYAGVEKLRPGALKPLYRDATGAGMEVWRVAL